MILVDVNGRKGFVNTASNGVFMKYRAIISAGLAILVLSIAIIAILNLRSKPCPIDMRPETRAKLTGGMSEREIAEILGGPPGDYTTRPNVEFMGSSGSGVHAPFVMVTIKQWRTDNYAIIVHFDSEGKAGLIMTYGANPPSESYPSPLREILHPFVDP